MKPASPFDSYRKVATQTATPGQLVLMLYDGAIKFLNQARQGFDCEDPLDFNLTINNNIQRAQAIIQELNSSLDMQGGGEVSENFRRLYSYMEDRLHDANMKKEPEGIDDVLRRVTILRDAWAEMLGKSEDNPAATLDQAALAVSG